MIETGIAVAALGALALVIAVVIYRRKYHG